MDERKKILKRIGKKSRSGKSHFRAVDILEALEEGENEEDSPEEEKTKMGKRRGIPEEVNPEAVIPES